MTKFMKSIAALMVLVMAMLVVGCTKPEGPDNNGNGGDNGGGNNGGGIYNGYAYVNLGLPSGLLWATCNVGADTPEGYGDYFAWGETRPKDGYDWDNYVYCDDVYSQLIKYCNNSNYGYNGFTDNLTTLLPDDDAATVTWGNGWLLPTKEEWEELHENTTHTWYTLNGVNGYLFTAANGNSLFLPAAGSQLGDNFIGEGNGGFYWSSSLYLDNPYSAWCFFSSSICYINGYGRISGKSVRAVHSER